MKTMKKMMMMVAVFAIAGAASAANLQWYVSANSFVPQAGAWGNNPGQNPNNTPFVYALVLASDTAAAITAFTTDGFTISGANEASGVFLDWAPSTASRGASGGIAAPNVANASAIMTSPQDYVAFAFQQVGSDWYYLQSAAVPNRVGYVSDPDLGDITAFTAAQFGGTSSAPWTAVPEPTSMALLALGVAALGLRRKFRA
jgi:hypothetical protein